MKYPNMLMHDSFGRFVADVNLYIVVKNFCYFYMTVYPRFYYVWCFSKSINICEIIMNRALEHFIENNNVKNNSLENVFC